jgi:DNA (cytosine-5)-methyltransferase 1
MRTVAFCEIDPYCQAVLRRHWPDVPVFDDVRTLTATDVSNAAKQQVGIAGQSRINSGVVDVICGGFPCQDISIAGKGEGITGSRSGLWKEFARIIGEIRPRYVIVENVAALLGRGLGDVLGDLAALGYDAEWHCIPASAVGAPHRRDRVWIVGHPMQSGLSERTAIRGRPGEATTGLSWDVSSVSGQWDVEPDVGRVAHGVPARVDRLKALGNTVVPQIAEIIGRAIMKMEHPDEKKAIQDQTSASR